jgi:hypothetical protein
MSEVADPTYRRVRAAANTLGAIPAVRATSLTSPDEDPYDSWTVELTVNYDDVDDSAPDRAVGPTITDEIARAGLWVKGIQPRADWMTVVATAGDPQ